jgi:hypothetical protein
MGRPSGPEVYYRAPESSVQYLPIKLRISILPAVINGDEAFGENNSYHGAMLAGYLH